MENESLDQMKDKVANLVVKLIKGLPQSELVKIAFSVKHWADDSCPPEALFIPRPPRDIDHQDRLAIHSGSRRQMNPVDEERMVAWREKTRQGLQKMSQDGLIRVIMEEVDSLSYQSMSHLSRSLLALKQRK